MVWLVLVGVGWGGVGKGGSGSGGSGGSVARCDAVVWCGEVWCGVVWCGLIRSGMVRGVRMGCDGWGRAWVGRSERIAVDGMVVEQDELDQVR